MGKLKNSPGRQNERRIAAAKRLGKDAPASLLNKIVSPDTARAIRTKKDRSARAQFARRP